jgi:hypothetical protein
MLPRSLIKCAIGKMEGAEDPEEKATIVAARPLGAGRLNLLPWLACRT